MALLPPKDRYMRADAIARRKTQGLDENGQDPTIGWMKNDGAIGFEITCPQCGKTYQRLLKGTQHHLTTRLRDVGTREARCAAGPSPVGRHRAPLPERSSQGSGHHPVNTIGALKGQWWHGLESTAGPVTRPRPDLGLSQAARGQGDQRRHRAPAPPQMRQSPRAHRRQADYLDTSTPDGSGQPRGERQAKRS